MRRTLVSTVVALGLAAERRRPPRRSSGADHGRVGLSAAATCSPSTPDGSGAGAADREQPGVEEAPASSVRPMARASPSASGPQDRRRRAPDTHDERRRQAAHADGGRSPSRDFDISVSALLVAGSPPDRLPPAAFPRGRGYSSNISIMAPDGSSPHPLIAPAPATGACRRSRRTARGSPSPRAPSAARRRRVASHPAERLHSGTDHRRRRVRLPRPHLGRPTAGRSRFERRARRRRSRRRRLVNRTQTGARPAPLTTTQGSTRAPASSPDGIAHRVHEGARRPGQRQYLDHRRPTGAISSGSRRCPAPGVTRLAAGPARPARGAPPRRCSTLPSRLRLRPPSVAARAAPRIPRSGSRAPRACARWAERGRRRTALPRRLQPRWPSSSPWRSAISHARVQTGRAGTARVADLARPARPRPTHRVPARPAHAQDRRAHQAPTADHLRPAA